jgi:hypothetical protein
MPSSFYLLRTEVLLMGMRIGLVRRENQHDGER